MRARWAAILLLLSLAPPGCDHADTDAWLGARTLREISVDQARRLATDGRARLVQRRASEERLAPIRGATPLADDEILPEDPAQPDLLVVVATDRPDALHLAARLRREGHPRVAVVVGDRAEIADLARARAAAAQPHAPLGIERTDPSGVRE